MLAILGYLFLCLYVLPLVVAAVAFKLLSMLDKVRHGRDEETTGYTLTPVKNWLGALLGVMMLIEELCEKTKVSKFVKRFLED